MRDDDVEPPWFPTGEPSPARLRVVAVLNAVVAAGMIGAVILVPAAPALRVAALLVGVGAGIHAWGYFRPPTSPSAIRTLKISGEIARTGGVLLLLVLNVAPKQ